MKMCTSSLSTRWGTTWSLTNFTCGPRRDDDCKHSRTKTTDSDGRGLSVASRPAAVEKLSPTPQCYVCWLTFHPVCPSAPPSEEPHPPQRAASGWQQHLVAAGPCCLLASPHAPPLSSWEQVLYQQSFIIITSLTPHLSVPEVCCVSEIPKRK